MPLVHPSTRYIHTRVHIFNSNNQRQKKMPGVAYSRVFYIFVRREIYRPVTPLDATRVNRTILTIFRQPRHSSSASSLLALYYNTYNMGGLLLFGTGISMNELFFFSFFPVGSFFLLAFGTLSSPPRDLLLCPSSFFCTAAGCMSAVFFVRNFVPGSYYLTAVHIFYVRTRIMRTAVIHKTYYSTYCRSRPLRRICSAYRYS